MCVEAPRIHDGFTFFAIANMCAFGQSFLFYANQIVSSDLSSLRCSALPPNDNALLIQILTFLCIPERIRTKNHESEDNYDIFQNASSKILPDRVVSKS